MKLPLILFLFLLCSLRLRAQDLESDIFQGICSGLVRNNNNSPMKKQLKGTQFLIDPVRGDTLIRYTLPTPEVRKFQSFSKARQVEILSATDLPIFPLKRRLYIVDTLNFFTGDNYANIGGYYFKVVRSIAEAAPSDCLYLYKVGLRQNDLILSFSFSNSKSLNNYYFKIFPESVKLERSKLIEPNAEHE